jgi:hypothetical protein
MSTKLTVATALGLMSLSSGAIFAHHSAVRFDNTTPVTIKGTLRRAEIAAPHSILYVEQATPDGTVVWAVEGPAPNQLTRRGFVSDDFREGDTIEACGYLLRDDVRSPDGSRLLLAEVLVMPDGAARLWSPYGNERCRDQGIYDVREPAPYRVFGSP